MCEVSFCALCRKHDMYTIYECLYTETHRVNSLCIILDLNAHMFYWLLAAVTRDAYALALARTGRRRRAHRVLAHSSSPRRAHRGARDSNAVFCKYEFHLILNRRRVRITKRARRPAGAAAAKPFRTKCLFVCLDQISCAGLLRGEVLGISRGSCAALGVSCDLFVAL